MSKGRNKGKQRVTQRHQPFTKKKAIFRVESYADRFVVVFDTMFEKVFCHNGCVSDMGNVRINHLEERANTCSILNVHRELYLTRRH